jgi:hypothetical protein
MTGARLGFQALHLLEESLDTVLTQGCDDGDPGTGPVLGRGTLGDMEVEPVLSEVVIILQKHRYEIYI